MEIHRELSDLVSRAGEGVLRDATEFRAAVDDFLGERTASEGELNLLTDAIRLGCLQRVVEQIDHGAEPSAAVDAQAPRLAELRGTQETTGARWALTVLAFALGRVDDALVQVAARATAADQGTRLPLPPHPAPVPTSPPGPPPPPWPVPPSPPAPASSPLTELATTQRRAGGEPPHSAARPAPRRRRKRWPVVAAAVVLLATAAIGGVVVLRDRDTGDDVGTQGGDASPRERSSAPTLAAGRVLAAPSARPAAADGRVVMGGRVGGVTVSALGEVDRTGSGGDAMVAADGQRLVAFTLADGPCQVSTCQPWQKLPLRVVVDGQPVPLPAGGPTFVVAAADDARVELQYDVGGFDQRVSLDDGSSTGENIVVLARERRSASVGGSTTLVPTGVPRITPRPRHVTVGKATLSFFDRGPALRDPRKAHLRIGVTYTRDDYPGDTFVFAFNELNLENAQGKRYPKVNLTPTADKPDVVFVVPADFTRGRLVIGGTSTTYDQGVAIAFTVPRAPFPVSIPLE